MCTGGKMAANPMMGIEAFGGIKGAIGIPESIFAPQAQAQQAGSAGFNDLLNMAIKSLNETQSGADAAMEQLAAGQNIELHDVVLAAQKASLSLQLAIAVKGKITDAYQSIMSMQV
jgi:flagellar hook-basal body complex protein FliE